MYFGRTWRGGRGDLRSLTFACHTKPSAGLCDRSTPHSDPAIAALLISGSGLFLLTYEIGMRPGSFIGSIVAASLLIYAVPLFVIFANLNSFPSYKGRRRWYFLVLYLPFPSYLLIYS